MADPRLTEKPPACPGFSLLDRVLLGLCAAAVILTALLLYAVPALAHGHFSWVMNHSNSKGTNCCGPYDTTHVSHEVANSAQIGTVIVAEFPAGTLPVVVNKIMETEDPEGRPVLTAHGCLFIRRGT